MNQLETSWEETYQPNRFSLWDVEQLKYDNNNHIGTWLQASEREKQHMRTANVQEKKFPKDSIDYIAWRVNSQVTRIRTPHEEGGSAHPPTVRNLLHIAYNLGAIGGIRQSSASKIPPLTNYIQLD